MTDLRSPYPWFGGKSRVAPMVWQRFGHVPNYVEPFFGSGAVLLGRPEPEGTETVNDLNGWLCNFWRALQADPEAVAKHADNPVSELDLHARGNWLFYREGSTEFVERLRSDPDYYDVKSAGWWVWGQCCWIAGGWGRDENKAKQSVKRSLPLLIAGMGVHRKRPQLGNAGMGVNRQPSDIDSAEHLQQYMSGLAARVRRVRVCCGDWSRVCGPTHTVVLGTTAVFLDPPYAVEDRADCYGSEEDKTVAHAVREWAIEHGDDQQMRIAICGYEGEHVMPDTWDCVPWKAHGGYANKSISGNDNAHRERIWFSPHCVPVKQRALF